MLSIMLPQTRACVKIYDDENKWMYFLTEDEELLKKIMKSMIKSAISKSIKTRFDN